MANVVRLAMVKAALQRLRNTLRKRREVPMLVPSRGRVGTPKISVLGVDHTYANEVAALHDVTLDVHPGEFLCLLGPSGCGKTTLLYALAGAFKPSGGDIRIDGRPVEGPSPSRLLMFQEAALFPWLTVEQNVRFALGGVKGLHRRERHVRTQEFLHLVNLDGFEQALPHELSGGMRMRASLARALAMNPAVLLMDEPFAPLDAETRSQMHELLQRIWTRSHKTVVFVTHNVREALVLGDRVVVMAARPGRILWDLEVRLPRPRDPDDQQVVDLSRKIREALRQAEGMRPDRDEA
jgi:NitT/TauT family transport system ATP-binding protein